MNIPKLFFKVFFVIGIVVFIKKIIKMRQMNEEYMGYYEDENYGHSKVQEKYKYAKEKIKMDEKQEDQKAEKKQVTKKKTVEKKTEKVSGKKKSKKDGSDSSLNDRQQKILLVLEDKKEVTMQDIRDLDSNVSERTIRRDLKYMSDQGLLVKEGKTKSAVYKLV